MENYFSILPVIAVFFLIALASKDVGNWFARFKLPQISGFLFVGLIAGPFVLGLISTEAIDALGFIDEISLAFIAFAAGSELYLKELRDRLKSIAWITIGLVIATFTLGSLAVLLLADIIPFLQPMPLAGRVAVAILVGVILVARSPSAAIAIINEVRAKGPFTQTALGVTVIMDVVVIILFAINSSAADALLIGLSFNLGFVELLAFDLFLALGLGYVLAKILQLIMAGRFNHFVKIALILLTGLGVFFTTKELRHISHTLLPVELLIEPLLVCMIGSFVLVNFSRYRLEFLKIVHDNGLLIYILFFTLVGASLRLDILAQTWPIALALFGVRLAGIFIGSFGGGVVAGEPMAHNRIRWLAFITQAGVAIGLAKEVAVEFTEFGEAFATLIISVVVLNEIVGPLCFKYTINHVGEAHPRGETHEFDGVRDALIFGAGAQALVLARQLCAHGWQVKVASTKNNENMQETANSSFDIYPVSNLNLETLHRLKAKQAEAIVTMLSDEENYQICELAYEHFGTTTLVARLNNRANFNRFQELGVLIVDPATAMVSLIDHLVRSPSAARLLLGSDEGYDIIDVEVRDPNLHGVAVRDLNLPLDTLILMLYRDGQALISHGHTRLKLGDQVTVVGTAKSLDELMLRFEL